jgi:hypothetical protein
MTKPTLPTFRQLVELEYTAKGKSLEALYASVREFGGVCRDSCRAALRGTRVGPETALSLTAWALAKHNITIDTRALEYAPKKQKLRKAG